MRVDLPHLRLIESEEVVNSDEITGNVLCGGTPQILQGFEIVAGTSLNPANLSMTVADATIIHPTASVAGALLVVDSDQVAEVLSPSNTRVLGGWTAGKTNFVGIDFVRTADVSTSDTVQFLDRLTGVETPSSLPLGLVLDYRIVISTLDFRLTPNIAPAAMVVLDGNGNITGSVIDCRNMMFSLANGGSVVDPNSKYEWPTVRTDREISSLRDAVRAIETRLWELGGGEKWYSATADRNVILACVGPAMVPAGGPVTETRYFTYTGGTGALAWKNLAVFFSNSTGTVNLIADGSVTLTDGDVAYVDLNRAVTDDPAVFLTVTVGEWAALGDGAVPGSRLVLAWRYSGTQVMYRPVAPLLAVL